MKQIWLVTQREYWSRVRKKSFLVMTLLGPLLIAAFYGALILLAASESSDKRTKIILVADESGVFESGIAGTEYLEFEMSDGSGEDTTEAYFAKLSIPGHFSLDQTKGIRIISKETLSISDQNNIETLLESEVKRKKLERAGIEKTTIDSLNTSIKISSARETGEGIVESNTMVNAGIGFAGAFLIYLFIFIYGVQVMKGVSEEKSNRIVEVIISSVKPFQLMMGKILGIAMVGLTQILVWIFLSFILIVTITSASGAEAVSQGIPASPGDTGHFFSAVLGLNFPLITGMFVFYFVSGYLLYSALFAAIASAVDSETDTQQFMLPVTIPLVLAIVVAQTAVLKDPHGPLATWFSMIPFTSPIVMMVRVPFGVASWQLLLSMLFMIFGFIGTTWLAARIYRVGILMYGKKASYKELFKWLIYKG
jgi:ABC-2 type transport system permease protein